MVTFTISLLLCLGGSKLYVSSFSHHPNNHHYHTLTTPSGGMEPSSSVGMDVSTISYRISSHPRYYDSSIRSMHPSSFSGSSRSSTALGMGLRSFLRIGKGKKKDDDKNGKKGKGKEEKGEDSPEDIKAALEAIKADLEAVEKVSQEEKKKKKLEEEGKKKNAKKESDSTSSVTSKNQPIVASTTAPLSKKMKPLNTNDTSKPKSRVTKTLKKITIPNTKQNTSTTSSSTSNPKPKASPHSPSRYSETVRDRVKRVKSGAMTEDEKLAFLNNALTPRTSSTSSKKQQGPRIRQAIPEPADVTQRPSLRSKSSKGSSNNRKDSLWSTVLGSKQNKEKGGRSPYNIEDVVGSDVAKKKYLDMVTDPNRFSSYAAMGGYEYPSSSPSTTGTDGKTKEEEKSTSNLDAVDNLKSVLNKEEDDNTDSLANRLHSSAIIKEKQDAELKAQRDLERQAEKIRIAEAQRQAAEEIRRREELKMQQAKEEQERIMKEEEEKRLLEENRQKAILAAQEEYWAKQLEKKRDKDDVSIMSNEDKERNLEKITRAAREGGVIEKRAEQRDESQILKEVSSLYSNENIIFCKNG